MKVKFLSFWIENLWFSVEILFSFSYPHIEKILFLGQIFEIKITMNLHVLRSPEFENRILAVGLCLSIISITGKQIAAEISNFVILIWIICSCYLKFFIKMGQKNSNTLRPMDRISYFILVYLDCTKYNEINIHFSHAQKHVTNRIWHEYHSKLVYKTAEK